MHDGILKIGPTKWKCRHPYIIQLHIPSFKYIDIKIQHLKLVVIKIPIREDRHDIRILNGQFKDFTVNVLNICIRMYVDWAKGIYHWDGICCNEINFFLQTKTLPGKEAQTSLCRPLQRHDFLLPINVKRPKNYSRLEINSSM